MMTEPGEDTDVHHFLNIHEAAPRQTATIEIEKVTSPSTTDHNQIQSSKILDEAMLSPQMLKDITQMQDTIKSRLQNNTAIAWSLKRRQ